MYKGSLYKEKHLLGLKEIRLQDGTTIQIYNMERTICDIGSSKIKKYL